MTRRIGFAAAATLLALALGAPSWAAGPNALSRLASSLGFIYTPVLSQGAVTLSRPGVTVVLRPGDRFYEVNDEQRSASVAPSVVSNEVYVSEDVAQALRVIARRPASIPTERPERSPILVSSLPVSGPISLSLAREDGQQAVRVNGLAPARAPITITLTAQLSRDIPTVVLSRTFVTAAADGRYDALISVGPDYFRESVITADVTSPIGTPARATLKYNVVPNPSSPANPR